MITKIIIRKIRIIIIWWKVGAEKGRGRGRGRRRGRGRGEGQDMINNNRNHKR